MVYNTADKCWLKRSPYKRNTSCTCSSRGKASNMKLSNNPTLESKRHTSYVEVLSCIYIDYVHEII